MPTVLRRLRMQVFDSVWPLNGATGASHCSRDRRSIRARHSDRESGEVTCMRAIQHTTIRNARVGRHRFVQQALLLAFVSLAIPAHGQQAVVQPSSGATGPEAGDVAETGKKLSNPLSDVWALFTEFDFNFSDGNLNSGHPRAGGRTLFQPILPIPLHGTGDKEWKLITRPTIPFFSSQPIPTGANRFNRDGGLGDIQVPMLISPPVKSWILGAGPTLLFPTATKDAFGRRQYGASDPPWSSAITRRRSLWESFPSTSSESGSRRHNSDVADASYMNLLYFMSYNLTNAWQIGFSPTITYDRRASVRQQMERARRAQRIEGYPDGRNDLEIRARLRILRRQRGRFRPARYGQAQRNPSDSLAYPQAAVRRQMSRYAWRRTRGRMRERYAAWESGRQTSPSGFMIRSRRVCPS